MRAFIPGLLLTYAAAQQPALWPLPTEHHHLTPLSPANFTGSATGHLTGAGHPDVVMLRDGVPMLFNSPAARNALATIPGAPTGCTAIATRRIGMSSGHRVDAVVVANGTGLLRWTAHDATWTPLANSAHWANTTQMHSADLDGNGYEELIGVTTAGTKLAVKIATSDGGYGHEFTTNLAAAVTSISDVATTNPANPEPRSIAIAQAGSVLEFSRALNLRTVRAFVGQNAILATLRNIPEQLICASRSSGIWSIAVLDPGQTKTVTIGALDLVAARAADADGDGNQDLLFSQRHNHRALLLFFRPGQTARFSMAPADALEIPLIGDATQPSLSAAAAPSNQAVPVFTDLNGDGTADLVHPVASVGDIVVARNTFGFPGLGLTPDHITGTGDQTTIRLFVEPATIPAGATHFEVFTWQMMTTVAGVVPNPTPMASFRRQAVGPTVDIVVDEWYMVSTPENATSTGVYYAQIRAVTMTGGVVVKVHTPFTALLSEDRNTASGTPAGRVLRPRTSSTQTLGGIGGSNVVIVNPPPPTPPASGGNVGPL